MANKLKKSTTPKAAAEKPGKTEKAEKVSKKLSSEKLNNDREEKIDLKKLTRDERTWKIIGTVSLSSQFFFL